MNFNLKKTAAAVAVSLMAITPVAMGVTVLSVDAAIAGNGNGKGNGNGNGNKPTASGSSLNHGQANKEARNQILEEYGVANWGAIASELGSLNAAHASQNGLEHASPDSMPGKLYAYQETDGIDPENREALLAAQDAIAAYEATCEGGICPEHVEPVLADFATSEEYAAALDEYNAYQTYQDDLAIVDQYQEPYDTLAATKDGAETITDAALDALNGMLRLFDF